MLQCFFVGNAKRLRKEHVHQETVEIRNDYHNVQS